MATSPCHTPTPTTSAGEAGEGVSCVQETADDGRMVTPTPGLLGHHSGLEVSKVAAGELLPWKGNSYGMVCSF